MTTLSDLKTEELRDIIRALRLKTIVKGYSKMKHAELVDELNKLIDVGFEDGETVVNLKQIPTQTTVRLAKKEPKQEPIDGATPLLLSGGAVQTRQKTKKATQVPPLVDPVVEEPTPSSTNQVADMLTNFANDDDVSTTSTATKKIRAPPLRLSGGAKKKKTSQ